jgi:hypothetical protein
MHRVCLSVLFACFAASTVSVHDQVLANAKLAGFHIRDTWAYVEPTSSTHDWRYLDGQITRAKRLGKRLTLGVYCGINSPNWIRTDLGLPQVQYIGGAPAPWDIRVTAAHQSMVQALGQHYAGESTIVAVHISSTATNQSLEMHYPNGLTSARGYSDAQMIAVWQDAIDDYSRAFPRTALVLDVAMVPDDGGGVTNAVTSYARLTLGPRINFIHCSLHATTSSTAPVHMTVVTLGRQGARIGFEMLCPSTDRQRFGGPFSTALAIGNSAGASWYQIYQADVQNLK